MAPGSPESPIAQMRTGPAAPGAGLVTNVRLSPPAIHPLVGPTAYQ